MFDRRIAIVAAAIGFVVASCSSSIGGELPATTEAPPDTVANPGGINVTGSTTPDIETTTTEAPEIPYTPVPLTLESPEFEAVTITTADDIDLYAEYYRRGPTAILYTHHIATSRSGPFDSSSNHPWTWTLADHGYTVLAPDLRGHGQSEGTIHVNDTKLDIDALYQFLVDEGFETIVSFNIWGSGPMAVNANVTSDAVDFDGMALLFTPLARNGNDLVTDLPLTTVPIWIVQSDFGSSGGIPYRLTPYTPNLWDAFVFPRVPTGLTFQDVYGEEYVGRMIAFLDHIENSG